jgi:hypothetical protein
MAGCDAVTETRLFAAQEAIVVRRGRGDVDSPSVSTDEVYGVGRDQQHTRATDSAWRRCKRPYRSTSCSAGWATRDCRLLQSTHLSVVTKKQHLQKGFGTACSSQEAKNDNYGRRTWPDGGPGNSPGCLLRLTWSFSRDRGIGAPHHGVRDRKSEGVPSSRKRKASINPNSESGSSKSMANCSCSLRSR